MIDPVKQFALGSLGCRSITLSLNPVFLYVFGSMGLYVYVSEVWVYMSVSPCLSGVQHRYVCLSQHVHVTHCLESLFRVSGEDTTEESHPNFDCVQFWNV